MGWGGDRVGDRRGWEGREGLFCCGIGIFAFGGEEEGDEGVARCH